MRTKIAIYVLGIGIFVNLPSNLYGMHGFLKHSFVTLSTILVIGASVSCSTSRSYSCKTDGAYKKLAIKKNKNNSGLVYSQKPNPLRKPYIIKNKRK